MSHVHPRAVLLEEALDWGGAVVGRPILHQEQRLRGLRQHPGQKSNVALTVQLAVDALVEQPPAEELNQAEHLVGLAPARGLDHRLLSNGSPGVAQRAPLGEARFIPEQQQAPGGFRLRSEEHTSELQSRFDLVCRLLLEKKKKNYILILFS